MGIAAPAKVLTPVIVWSFLLIISVWHRLKRTLPLSCLMFGNLGTSYLFEHAAQIGLKVARTETQSDNVHYVSNHLIHSTCCAGACEMDSSSKTAQKSSIY
ncbi:hypothetical protein BH10CYA1_BH10CYA1_61360 [soil metagenome]